MSIKDLSFEFLKAKLLPAVIVLIIGSIVVKMLTKLIDKLLKKASGKIDPMVDKFILSAAKIGMWVIVLMVVFKLLGLDTSSIVALFAAAGAAVALALQGSLSNLASGIIIMATKPFTHGDYVECAGAAGTVEAIDLLATTIITVDNKVVTVPNSQLTGGTITNFSKMDTRRVDIEIGVAYESDVDLAKNAILEAAKKEGFFLENPAPTCNVLDHAESAIILVFRGWVKNADYWNAFFGMNNAIKPALDEKGIAIPFPQIDVHTK